MVLAIRLDLEFHLFQEYPKETIHEGEALRLAIAGAQIVIAKGQNDIRDLRASLLCQEDLEHQNLP